MPELVQIREAWDQAARDDAMGNILTIPGVGRDAFFASGRAEIAAVFEHLERIDAVPPAHVALDFGCGIGRISLALAERFTAVHAVDVSVEMIARASRHPHVRYHAWDSLVHFADGYFDLVYSNITLQHMPSELQRGYVEDFIRVLNDRGVAVFEVPENSDQRDYIGAQTMYGTPVRQVEDWIRCGGGELVDVVLTGAATEGMPSYRYVARRA